jgi:hypothetical protein
MPFLQEFSGSEAPGWVRLQQPPNSGKKDDVSQFRAVLPLL